MSVDRLVRWALACVAALLATVAAFELLVRVLRPEWSSSEHLGLAIWTLPLLPLVLLVARASRARRRRFERVARAGAVAAIGAALGFAFAFAMFYATGGYIMAFDVSPLWPWIAGAVAGLGVSDILERRSEQRREPPAAA